LKGVRLFALRLEFAKHFSLVTNDGDDDDDNHVVDVDVRFGRQEKTRREREIVEKTGFASKRFQNEKIVFRQNSRQKAVALPHALQEVLVAYLRREEAEALEEGSVGVGLARGRGRRRREQTSERLAESLEPLEPLKTSRETID